MAKRKSKTAKKPKVTTQAKSSSANGTARERRGNGAPVQQGKVQTVTFRIPAALKKSVEQAARGRGMTTTRFVVEALESEVNDEPPRWWDKARSSPSEATAPKRAS